MMQSRVESFKFCIFLLLFLGYLSEVFCEEIILLCNVSGVYYLRNSEEQLPSSSITVSIINQTKGTFISVQGPEDFMVDVVSRKVSKNIIEIENFSNEIQYWLINKWKILDSDVNTSDIQINRVTGQINVKKYYGKSNHKITYSGLCNRSTKRQF